MTGPSLLLSALLAVAAPGVEQWGVFELTLTAPAEGNPYLDVQWSATFTQGTRQITVPGFWDGGETYRLRFSPPTLGEWRYATRSSTPALDGQRGTFTVGASTGSNHGPVEVFQTHYLRYADGTPYHQFGTTCYAWVHQTEDLQRQTLATLAASPFNKIRFCVFPKAYTYDATRTADNVSWYFSEPRDAPGPASVALDRKTTYQAGPVEADIGPLAVGNFNATMHGYGLDRQFRGEIRDLRLFGSRVGGRGAMNQQSVRNQLL